MIELKNFSIGYGSNILLKDVNVTIPDKKLTSLIGRNGTGKSTFMKAICGLNSDYKGQILIKGKDIKKMTRKELAETLAYVNTQRPRISNLKCKDVVALGRTPYTGWHGILSDEDKDHIKEAFEMVGMNDYLDRQLLSLSDGECQKIMIARAIAQDTPVIILDEPTSFLDLPMRYELANLLKSLTRQKNKTILFSTHELDIALRFSDDITLVYNKNLIILPTKEMKSSGQLDRAFPNIF